MDVPPTVTVPGEMLSPLISADMGTYPGAAAWAGALATIGMASPAIAVMVTSDRLRLRP
jgi:hypothetical protein